VLAFIALGASILFLILARQGVGPAAQLPNGVVLRVSGAVSQPEKQSPVRIIVPQEKKGARWIRMVETNEVVKLH